MAWTERIDRRARRTKTFQDSENPDKFALDATLAVSYMIREVDLEEPELELINPFE